jgi:hypothetical protein
MTTYTITYSETENKAMEYASVSVDDWIQNAAHERARIAIEDIVHIAVQKFLEAGQSIPGSKEEIVATAFANGWVKTAAQRNEETVLPTA